MKILIPVINFSLTRRDRSKIIYFILPSASKKNLLHLVTLCNNSNYHSPVWYVDLRTIKTAGFTSGIHFSTPSLHLSRRARESADTAENFEGFRLLNGSKSSWWIGCTRDDTTAARHESYEAIRIIRIRALTRVCKNVAGRRRREGGSRQFSSSEREREREREKERESQQEEAEARETATASNRPCCALCPLRGARVSSSVPLLHRHDPPGFSGYHQANRN